MTASVIRSSLTSGVAMAAIAGFLLTPPAPQTVLAIPAPAVASTAHVTPLGAQRPSALVHDLPDLINQQVSFHVAFIADFVGTGAVLVDRQLQIPITLVRDIQNGTPLPAAVGRALQTFVEIELDAGRELVGFAVQYIDFQIRFIAKVVNDVITASASMFAAVGDVIAPKVAAAAPAPIARFAEATSVPEAQPSDVAPDKAPESETRVAHSARPTMSLSIPGNKTTVSAQGEIRSGSSETTNPATEAASDEDAPTHRDDTTDQSEAPSAEPKQRQPDPTEADARQDAASSKGGGTNGADQSDSGDQ